MIELPGSFEGRINSPNPLLGPEAKNLISLAIFIQAAARVFKTPCKLTSASWVASASNLFGAVTNYILGFLKKGPYSLACLLT